LYKKCVRKTLMKLTADRQGWQAQNDRRAGTYKSHACVKDFGLHNQNIKMIILFVCLVYWLNSSPLELKKLRHDF
jgi:hypothetical protein